MVIKRTSDVRTDEQKARDEEVRKAAEDGSFSRDMEIERVAKAIYESMCEEREAATGKEDRVWRIEGVQWDIVPDEELCEWERDGYREMARAAIKAMREG